MTGFSRKYISTTKPTNIAAQRVNSQEFVVLNIEAKPQIPTSIINGAMSPTYAHPKRGNTAHAMTVAASRVPFLNIHNPTIGGFNKFISGKTPKSIVAKTACFLSFIMN